MHMPRRPGTPVTVTGRVLAILRTFSGSDGRGQSLKEISRRSGLPLSTTSRLVNELVVGDALSRDNSLRYRIGPGVRELAG